MEAATNRNWQEYPRLAACATRAEQFSIWAFRLWWKAFPRLDSAWMDFVHGFRVCGVVPAIEHCHRFCTIALANGGCGTGIACLHFARIVPLEERLLAALAAANSGATDRVEAHLRDLMPTSTARLAAPHAVRYAQILTCAGLQWPEPSVPAHSSTGCSGFAGVSLVSELLH